jgi:hypothetical protein
MQRQVRECFLPQGSDGSAMEAFRPTHRRVSFETHHIAQGDDGESEYRSVGIHAPGALPWRWCDWLDVSLAKAVARHDEAHSSPPPKSILWGITSQSYPSKQEASGHRLSPG